MTVPVIAPGADGPGPDSYEAAEAVCGQVLKQRYAGLRPPSAPADAEAWRILLADYPDHPAAVARLRRIKAEWRGLTGAPEAGPAEHYALLNALPAALPRLRSLPLARAVRQQFYGLCLKLAHPGPAWERQMDESRPAFMELAKLVSLQRFPAGELVFDITRLPCSWLAKVHPAALPGLLREISLGLGGRGPMLSPHLNSWRDNPLILQEKEKLRSLWRIAKTMEMNRDIKGLMGDSWFYSVAAAEQSPHLAWLRNFFLAQGAYLVDLEPAPEDSGFLVGSARRRQLYRQGLFCPRRTLVLWRRDAMLDWAARHPEWGEGLDPPPLRPLPTPGYAAVRPPPPARAARRNSRLSLGKGGAWLNRRPKTYLLAALAAPALAAALAAAWGLGAWAVAPAFPLALAALWVLQYFCLQ